MTGSYKGLKASELIDWLKQMMAVYGNCRVFMLEAYDTVGLVELYPPGEIYQMDEPLFVLSWSGIEPERNADGSFVLKSWEDE